MLEVCFFSYLVDHNLGVVGASRGGVGAIQDLSESLDLLHLVVVVAVVVDVVVVLV